MKLISHVTLRISIAITLILSVWAVFFYFTMISEINDEVDDSLDDYSEALIVRALSGEKLPSNDNGSNNQYYITEVTREYAMSHPKISYEDQRLYIDEKREMEPARVLTVFFNDAEGKYFRLVVATPTFEREDLRQSIFTWIVILYLILLLIIILLNVGVFYRSMDPLYRLLHWLDNYRLGQKNELLEERTQITEFRKLYQAAYSYADRNEQLFEQQKRFIGNASHEIQTPLAVCRNRLEMMMEEPGIGEKQLSELAKVHQTLENITRLSKLLLLLSKIDNDQFHDEHPVEVNTIVNRYLEDYKDVYAYRRISVEVKEEAILTWMLNDTLAMTLITNLLKNAFVHNVDGGHIRIWITAKTFGIANSGVPTPLDERHIYERFYKSGNHEGSTGLGLSIVDSICKISGLQINYSFTDGDHCFTLHDVVKS